MKQTVPALESQEIDRDLIFPAVRGEFYNYHEKFTDKKPLYVFLKCKSNKGRSTEDAEKLGREVNLFFLFGDSIEAQVCDVKSACVAGLLGDSVKSASFGETWIAPAGITSKVFYEIRSRKDVPTLTEICASACSKHETSMTLKAGSVVAMMTDAGKYGMFFVTAITPTSIEVDACHILI